MIHTHAGETVQIDSTVLQQSDLINPDLLAGPLRTFGFPS